MLKQRVVTAVILATLVVGAILYLPPIGFNWLALLLVTLAAWEFSDFFWKKEYHKRIGFLIIFFLVVILAKFFPAQPTLIVGVIWWLIVPYFLWQYSSYKKNYFTSIVKQMVVGLMIFVPCLIGFIEIQGKFGAEFLIYLLAIVCAVDIGAYFTGMFLGKQLLTPMLSPRKTYEGLCGGLLLALLVTIIWVLLIKYGMVNFGSKIFSFSGRRQVSLFMLVLITCLWSVVGDLFESMLKRQAGVKDSGQLLPGHGGIYDRIDGLTAAVPIFVLGLLLI